MSFDNCSFDYEQLLEFGKTPINEGSPLLPLPPLLMFNRITNISVEGGAYDKGSVVAELDIVPDMWFFKGHFHNFPVMPGCLGLDALWQLSGFFLSWRGFKGVGVALGVDKVKFKDMITPDMVSLLRYVINVKKVVAKKMADKGLTLLLSDGIVEANGKEIYTAENIKVGVFDRK